MQFLILLFSFFIIGFCDDTIYTNKVIDAQFKMMSKLFYYMKIKYLTIGDITVSDDIKVYGLRLGDLTKIVRKGDTTLNVDGESMIEQIGLGIDKMSLVMDSIKLNGKLYKKVLVVVYSNKLSYTSNLVSTKTYCNITYSNMKLSNVQGVMLYSRPSVKMNVTSQFIKEVVPFVNDQFKSQPFKRLVEKYMDFCRQPPHAGFMELIMDLSRDNDSSEASIDISKIRDKSYDSSSVDEYDEIDPPRVHLLHI